MEENLKNEAQLIRRINSLIEKNLNLDLQII